MAVSNPAVRPSLFRRANTVKRGRRTLVGSALRTGRGRVGAVLTLAVCAVAIIGPFVAPHSPTEFVGVPFSNPGGVNGVLGTDVLGRDVLSRVLCGGWLLLLSAVIATIVGLAVGTIAGMFAAYRQGWVDGLIMRTVDVFLSVPAIVFGLLLVSVVGPKLWLVILAIALTHAPQVARVIRAATMEIAERDFVRSAELSGVPGRRVLRGEILPNLVTPLTVETGLRLSYSIILIAGLSFLGFGIQPPHADWGRMISENRLGLDTAPWSVLAPSILIAVLAIGVNTFADAIARVSVGLDRAEVTVAGSGIDPAVSLNTLADDA
jgi:peptide/nickel transport system permease protein